MLHSNLYIFLTIFYVHAKLSQNSSGYQFLVTMDFVRIVQSVASYLVRYREGKLSAKVKWYDLYSSTGFLGGNQEED